MLNDLGYSLPAPRKRSEGTAHPDRNDQFEHINRTADRYPTGVKVTKSQMDQIALIPDGFYGEWNYELLPQ